MIAKNNGIKTIVTFISSFSQALTSFIITLITFLTLLTFTSFTSFLTSELMAQDASGGGGKDQILENTMSDLSIVIGAGLGGAVLGLSTLSFTDEPRNHLKNILIGASIGIVIGVAIVAWGQATKTQDQYTTDRKNIFINDDFYPGASAGVSATTKDFYANDRIVWHKFIVSNHFKNSKFNSSDVLFQGNLFSKTF
ncbi:MAG: hypothetical protein HQK49_01230 [Oligoflexia bacterium]|nr:hypothetical protein [Oligoflexia bacterium]